MSLFNTVYFLTIFDWLSHVQSELHENAIFNVGLLIIFGLIGGKLITLIKFPKVTGFILIGILIGPSVTGLINEEMVKDFSIIRDVAIGLIGYTIGLELRFSKLKKTGKSVTIITVSQALITMIVVSVVIILYGTLTKNEHALTYGLILGAIATATAPGPIVAVVKSYRTKGPVTDTLLPLVAMDDVIGIILFAIMLSLGTAFLSGPVSIAHMFLDPLKEIGFAIIIGLVLGFFLQYVVKKLNRETDGFLLMVIVGVLFFGIGLGIVVEASSILLPMVIGVVLTNSINEKYEHRLTKQTDLFSGPILLIFFALAGAELELSLLLKIGVIGLLYLFFRVVGKVYGAHISAKLVNAPKTVQKYLGWTLIPQAGVAINMALATQARFQEPDLIGSYEVIGSTIMTIVLAATVVYEVVGLIIVKTALSKANEIDAAVNNWQ
jgi:Kef-type K+ transport system membrane component KefB